MKRVMKETHVGIGALNGRDSDVRLSEQAEVRFTRHAQGKKSSLAFVQRLERGAKERRSDTPPIGTVVWANSVYPPCCFTSA